MAPVQVTTPGSQEPGFMTVQEQQNLPGNAFCLLALSTAIQNASPRTYQLAQVWKGEFYRFKDVEYITNDYPLKPPIFFALSKF